MCSHCSPAWAESTWGSNGQECESLDNAKPTVRPGWCFNAIGRMCLAIPMSPSSTRNGLRPMKYQPLKKMTEEQVEEAVRMYQSGLSLAKCAEPFGVSRQSMHDLLKRRIKLRDRLEAIPRLTDEERSKVQEKRNRALRRYRSRAKRITRAQTEAVKQRDKVCVKCSAPGADIDHIVPVMKGGQTEMSNLQFLCKECHIEKSRTDWKGVSRKEATQSTSFAEASRDHAKTCQSPANEKDSMVNDQSCSTKQPESLTLFSATEDGSSLRMYPDSFPQTVDETSVPFSRRWPNSGFTTSPGECWTADTSECPSGGGVFSSLPDVLEATVPSRFFLSPKAAAGILRRANKRGRDLPEPLDRALRALSETVPGSGDGKSARRMPLVESSSREAA